jgi:hypothetical protein
MISTGARSPQRPRGLVVIGGGWLPGRMPISGRGALRAKWRLSSASQCSTVASVLTEANRASTWAACCRSNVDYAHGRGEEKECQSQLLLRPSAITVPCGGGGGGAENGGVRSLRDPSAGRGR